MALGLAFSLAEAINLGIGAVGGSAATSIERKLQSAAFRRRLAKEVKRSINELSGVRTRDLTALLAETRFLDAAIRGDLATITSSGGLEAAVDRVMVQVSSGDVASIGRKVGRLFIELAAEDAEPVNRLLLHGLESIARQQESSRSDQLAALGELTSKMTELAARLEIPVASRNLVRVGSIPLPRKWFVGRTDTLERLRVASEQGGQVLALTGLGGVGKTSIIAKFALERADLDTLCWIDASSVEGIVSRFSELGKALGVDLLPGQTPMEHAQSVKTQIETLESEWLLVLDNVPDRSAVEDWVPVARHGTVVITSRNRNLSDIAEIVPVDILSHDEATGFLRDRVRSDNSKASADASGAGSVAEALDGLPLALEQAAAWVARLPVRTWNEYEELLAAVDLEAAFPRSTRPAGYPETVVGTWAVSVEAAKREDPLADFILQAMSFMASAPIPMAVVRAFGPTDAGPAMSALAALDAYSLVTVQSDATVNVHRLVQAASRRDAPSAAAVMAALGVALASPERVVDAAAWIAAQAVEPHLLHLFRRDHEVLSGVKGLREDLLRKTAILSGAIADWRSPAEAAQVGREVVERSALLLGELSPETLRSKKNWAALLLAAGRANDALPVLKETLEEQRAFSDDDDMASTVATLAVALSQTGDLAAADELRTSWREGLDGLGGADTQLLLRSNYAYHLQRSGDYEGALAVFREIVPQFESMLGADHPDTMKARQGLALTLGNLGETSTSIRLLTDLLEDKRRVLGEANISTLRTWETLGAQMAEAGLVGKGMESTREALRVAEEHLGHRHEMTIGLRRNVGVAIGQMGNKTEAVRIIEECYADAKNGSVLARPRLMDLAANLATAYVELGRYREGIELLHEVVSVESEMFGRDHPKVVVRRRVLDSYLSEARRSEVAGPVTPISRNAPCPCGSGRKYKMCHGRTSGEVPK